MSREQYLEELREELNILNYYRVDDALKNYSERFDEAKSFGTDESKVMEELGEPKELAKSINDDAYLFPTFLHMYFF